MGSERASVEAALPAYRLDDVIFRDAAEVVWLARHRGLDRDVAVRQFLLVDLQAGDVRSRFASAVRMLARLSHPHIVATYDYVEAEGSAFLVMERPSGGSLRDLQRRGELDPAIVCAIVLSVCAALDNAHRNGVVHGGVDADAVLLTAERVPRLTGFSVGTPKRERGAAEADDVRRTAEMLGVHLTADRAGAPLPPEMLEVAHRAIADSHAVRSAEELGLLIAEAARNAWGADWTARTGIVLRGVQRVLPSVRGGERRGRTDASDPFRRAQTQGTAHRIRRFADTRTTRVVIALMVAASLALVGGRLLVRHRGTGGETGVPPAALRVTPASAKHGSSFSVVPPGACPVLPAGWRTPRVSLSLFDPAKDEEVVSSEIALEADRTWEGSMEIPSTLKAGTYYMRARCLALAVSGPLLPYHQYPPSSPLTVTAG